MSIANTEEFPIYILGWEFDYKTKQLVSELEGEDFYIAPRTGLPANVTDVPVPTDTAIDVDEVWVYENESWVAKKNFVGRIAYSIYDKSSFVVTELGDLNADFTFEVPATPIDDWDAVIGKWVTDPIKLKEYEDSLKPKVGQSNFNLLTETNNKVKADSINRIFKDDVMVELDISEIPLDDGLYQRFNIETTGVVAFRLNNKSYWVGKGLNEVVLNNDSGKVTIFLKSGTYDDSALKTINYIDDNNTEIKLGELNYITDKLTSNLILTKDLIIGLLSNTYASDPSYRNKVKYSLLVPLRDGVSFDDIELKRNFTYLVELIDDSNPLNIEVREVAGAVSEENGSAPTPVIIPESMISSLEKVNIDFLPNYINVENLKIRDDRLNILVGTRANNDISTNFILELNLDLCTPRTSFNTAYLNTMFKNEPTYCFLVFNPTFTVIRLPGYQPSIKLETGLNRIFFNPTDTSTDACYHVIYHSLTKDPFKTYISNINYAMSVNELTMNSNNLVNFSTYTEFNIYDIYDKFFKEKAEASGGATAGIQRFENFGKPFKISFPAIKDVSKSIPQDDLNYSLIINTGEILTLQSPRYINGKVYYSYEITSFIPKSKNNNLSVIDDKNINLFKTGNKIFEFIGNDVLIDLNNINLPLDSTLINLTIPRTSLSSLYLTAEEYSKSKYTKIVVIGDNPNNYTLNSEIISKGNYVLVLDEEFNPSDTTTDITWKLVKLTDENMGVVTQQLTRTADSVSSLENKVDGMGSSYDSLSTDMVAIKSSVNDLTGKVGDLDNIKTDVSNITESVSNVTVSVQTNTSKIEEISTKASGLETSVEELNSKLEELVPLTQKTDDLTSSVANINSNIDSITSTQSLLEQNINSYKNDCDSKNENVVTSLSNLNNTFKQNLDQTNNAVNSIRKVHYVDDITTTLSFGDVNYVTKEFALKSFVLSQTGSNNDIDLNKYKTDPIYRNRLVKTIIIPLVDTISISYFENASSKKDSTLKKGNVYVVTQKLTNDLFYYTVEEVVLSSGGGSQGSTFTLANILDAISKSKNVIDKKNSLVLPCVDNYLHENPTNGLDFKYLRDVMNATGSIQVYFSIVIHDTINISYGNDVWAFWEKTSLFPPGRYRFYYNGYLLMLVDYQLFKSTVKKTFLESDTINESMLGETGLVGEPIVSGSVYTINLNLNNIWGLIEATNGVYIAHQSSFMLIKWDGLSFVTQKGEHCHTLKGMFFDEVSFNAVEKTIPLKNGEPAEYLVRLLMLNGYDDKNNIFTTITKMY